MYEKSVRNMISDMKPTESYETMSDDRLMMPMADPVCDMCGRCAAACSGKAISVGETWSVDLGKCLFCRDCYDSCIHITPIPAPNYVFRKEDLVFTPKDRDRKIEGHIDPIIVKRLGNSIAIRELDTGSCNACESEINAMSNKYYDCSRFGIRFVASPRHADMLLVTGPMTRNMLEAAKKTYDAVPEPKIVVACGTCAISGGLFVKGDVVGKGIDETLPADLYIVGCPPSPGRLVVSLIDAFGLRH
jgi:Ni,Fe-hydrogenase III small subunit